MSKTTQMAQSAYNQGLSDAAAGNVYNTRKSRWLFKGDYERGVKTYIDRMATSNPLDRDTIVSRVDAWPRMYRLYLFKNNPSLLEYYLHHAEALKHHDCTFAVDVDGAVTTYSYNEINAGKFPQMTIEVWRGKSYLIAHNYYAYSNPYDYTVQYNEVTGGGFDELDVDDDAVWTRENTVVDFELH